jgi:hydrogenase nickel incorporation protein HypA/HybF
MHELGISQEIVAIVSKRAQGRKVRRLVLEIGKLTAVLPDAVRYCFELCNQGTVAEGAELKIVEIAGRARCRKCNLELVLDRPFGRCLCGGTDLDWLAGEELNIKEMELADV